MKIKVTIGDKIVEIEIPLSERTECKFEKDTTLFPAVEYIKEIVKTLLTNTL